MVFSFAGSARCCRLPVTFTFERNGTASTPLLHPTLPSPAPLFALSGRFLIGCPTKAPRSFRIFANFLKEQTRKRSSQAMCLVRRLLSAATSSPLTLGLFGKNREILQLGQTQSRSTGLRQHGGTKDREIAHDYFSTALVGIEHIRS